MEFIAVNLVNLQLREHPIKSKINLFKVTEEVVKNFVQGNLVPPSNLRKLEATTTSEELTIREERMTLFSILKAKCSFPQVDLDSRRDAVLRCSKAQGRTGWQRGAAGCY